MTAEAPTGVGGFLLMLMAQSMSVIGDSFGQRASRVVHKGSRRRMMISIAIVSCLQMLVVLSILQAVLPQSVTGAVYHDRQRSSCYSEWEQQGCCPASGPSCACAIACGSPAVQNSSAACTEIACPSQGPSSIFRSIGQHPLLLINGVLDIVYYATETMVYQLPMGLIFLVIASLASTFLIQPFSLLFGLPGSAPLPPAVQVLGIAGALLCIVERKPAAARGKPSMSLNGDEDSSGETPLIGEAAAVLPSHADAKAGQSKLVRRLSSSLSMTLRVLVPFAILSVVYCLWFVTMDFYSNLFRVNMWGFNSIDQLLLPLYILPFLAAVDAVPLLRGLESEEDRKQSFLAALLQTLRELRSARGFATVFTYRLFINTRAMIYSYLALVYDLRVVYLELTLIRIVLSWIGALLLTVVAPRFIAVTEEERRVVLMPFNLIGKVVGTVCVTVSLFLLNK